jgi:colanic acid biosynthesis glycosyl transferase WcaI
MIMGQHYAPEDVSGAALATELTTDLVRMGYQVTFVTCAPSYPWGIVYPGYRNHLLSRETRDGVKVIRTWSYISKHKTFWRRILNYGTFSMTALMGGFMAGRPDLILAFSPPLPLGLAAWLVSYLQHIPFVFNVMDIYPEIAVASGVLRNRTAIALFSRIELFLYRQASHIQVLSEGFKHNLVNKGVPARKISVIPVWADPDAIRPLPRENSFRDLNGLKNKFVVMYSGNLGFNTCLEDVIEAADLLGEEQDIRFVLIGEGVKKQALVELCEQKALPNVLFLPFQPRNQVDVMLAASDLSVVSLSQGAHGASLPSKTFFIMAGGRPVLAITPLESELASLVLDTNCGVVVPPGRPDALARAILNLKKMEVSQLDWMAKNGRDLVVNRYSRQHCVQLYDQDFRMLI